MGKKLMVSTLVIRRIVNLLLIGPMSRVSASLSWQLMLLIIVGLFYPQLRTFATELINKIHYSSDISMGAVSLRIQTQINAAGDRRIAESIKGLDGSDVLLIMRLYESPYRIVGTDDGRNDIVSSFILPEPSRLAQYDKLEKRGLITAGKGLDELKQTFFAASNGKRFLPKSDVDERTKENLLAETVKLTDDGMIVAKVCINVIGTSLNIQ